MNRIVLALALLCAGCGGGGTSPVPVVAAATPAPSASPVASANPAATPTPNAKPSAAPTATAAPTTAPTAAPTATAVPLAQRVMGGAPLTATAAQLATTRRTAQAKTQAQGVANGLPILVESSGMVAAWAGDQAIWVTNAQTQTDIAETSGTITPSGSLALNNPGFTPLSCLASVSAVCVVHPTGWEFGTTSANGKPVGQQTLTIAFADGTVGATYDYVYDGWNLPCNSGWAYVGGVPVAQATKATSDVYADCVAGNIVFPRGGMLFLSPAQDQYGRYETIMPSVLAAINIVSFQTNFAMPTTTQGQVYAVATQDGGFAKVYFTNGASATTLNSATGLSLHAQANGTYLF
jgi:hypothetical protein